MWQRSRILVHSFGWETSFALWYSTQTCFEDGAIVHLGVLQLWQHLQHEIKHAMTDSKNSSKNPEFSAIQ
jgi:hypothetical protein